MTTLELVPLRSKFPNSGRMTVRYPSPVINSVAPLDLIVEDILDSLDVKATPQVAVAEVGADETAAGKGGTAR